MKSLKKTLESSSSNDIILPHQLNAIKSLNQKGAPPVGNIPPSMLELSNLKYPRNPDSIKHTPSKTTAIIFYTKTALASIGSYQKIVSKTQKISRTYRSFMKLNDIKSDLPGNYFYWYLALESDKKGEVIERAIMQVPDSICRQVPGGCESGNYSALIAAISGSQLVRDLKQSWKADVTMLYVNRSDTGGVVGKATLLTRPRDFSQANKAVIVASINQDPSVYIHEIMHNLGAGHSTLNKQSGVSPGNAFMNYFNHGGKRGVKTFMAYQSVCDRYYPAIHPCTGGCFALEQLSTPLKKQQ